MKNIDGLQRYSKQRNKETFEKVNRAITSLKRSKKKITIAEVARKASVSVATIYNNPKLKEHIIQLKELSNINGHNKETVSHFKAESVTKMDELKNKNKDLREKIDKLKIEKGLLLGKLKDLASENLELKIALEQCRKVKFKNTNDTF